MVAHGHADAMITGLTRTYHAVLEDVLRVIDPKPGCRIFGLSVMLAKGRTVFIADTTVHELPDTKTLADIATQTARTVRAHGLRPRAWPCSRSPISATRRSPRPPAARRRRSSSTAAR